ncbi:MAG: fused MFS/spermidine synthase [Sedimentisphaerales bacterium]|nr:fused MFS/spermidine synthase [Sedimentisphaerales bacterium]
MSERFLNESTTSPISNRFLPVVLLLFIGSGCSALIYEIVWFQLLQLVIGSSAVSLGVLLGTYMGGMCLGSIILPRIISRRHHPLRVYALLELGIGIIGIVVLFGIPYINRIYTAHAASGFSGVLLRGAVCGLCLLPPTLLMGATLPAISRWIEMTPKGVSWLGFFYGGNIAGAVCGCLFAGFYLLRIYDITIATYAAASINVVIALMGLGMSGLAMYRLSDDIQAEHSYSRKRFHAWHVYVTIGLSGMSALGAEVIWTRLLSLMLGATVYTFSIILAVFLVGLGIGSGIGSVISRHARTPRFALGLCQLLLVAAIAWTSYMINNSLPYWPIDPSLSGNPWINFQLDLLRCIWAVLPAACLWGASFPLAIAAVATQGEDPGWLVGKVYAANTVGAIIGAIGFSMITIPIVGTQQAQRMIVVLAALAGLIMLLPLYGNMIKNYCNLVKMSWTRILFSSNGRINRRTFWCIYLPIFILINIIVVIVQALPEEEKVESTLSLAGYMSLLIFIVFFSLIIAWASLSILFKRWHDRNRSGGMVLINLIPVIGPIWSWVELGFLRGTIGPNRYGEDSLQSEEKKSDKTKTVFPYVVGTASLIVILVLIVVLVGSVSKIPWGLIAYGRHLPTMFEDSEVLYVDEGMNASIAVTELEDGIKCFHVSGKVVASTDPLDMRLQLMLGHMPALFHPKPRSVLVVGCGAAVTAGTFVQHPDIEKIVICEIEPLIPKVAGEQFGKENNYVLQDPRVELIIDDARHYILTTKEKFDIITSDPIHPWVKGAASLYTDEYFELCKQRLNPGGIVTQWVPLYESNLDAVKSEIATFFEVFPYGTIWSNDSEGEGYDIVILGQLDPMKIDIDKLQQRLESNDYLPVRNSLNSVGFHSAIDLLATYAGRKRDLNTWLSDAQINRDRNMRLQYLAGMGLNSFQSESIYKEMIFYRLFPEDIFIGSGSETDVLMKAMGLYDVDDEMLL